MRTLIIAVVLIAALKALGQNDSRRKSTEYQRALIREERSIIVDGVQETWRLQWASAPKVYWLQQQSPLWVPADDHLWDRHRLASIGGVSFHSIAQMQSLRSPRGDSVME
jgi:hypothetical protein